VTSIAGRAVVVVLMTDRVPSRYGTLAARAALDRAAAAIATARSVG
jgi:hypothetical protein